LSPQRLPNEVKKKLYASRFQKSLKQIMKYNTDGDPLNAFSKHVEVITAALGATFVDMIRLKKMYYRRVRVLEQRRQQANRRASSFRITSSGRPTVAFPGVEKHSPFVRAQSETTRVIELTKAPGLHIPNAVADPATTPEFRGVSAAWGDEMQRKCETTLALLKKIEADVRGTQRTRSW
jgi:hypothetical protein